MTNVINPDISKVNGTPAFIYIKTEKKIYLTVEDQKKIILVSCLLQ